MLGCLWACDTLPEKMPLPQGEAFVLPVPRHLADGVPSPSRNPLSKKGIELGRMLFYDPLLSGNNQVSCATCHRQSLGFADGQALATSGVSGRTLLRHAPALVNLAWHPGLFWDGGASDLESQVFAPLTHADEMDQDLTELMQELKHSRDYEQRFVDVFGAGPEPAYVARALAQFQRSLVSANSPFDRYLMGQRDLAPLEEQGLHVYEKKCASCHQPPFFTDFEYHNNGLDSSFADSSELGLFQGRFRITGRADDLGKFKTPTLRNVAASAPYMHDGRLPDLKAVLDHYQKGIISSPSLDSALVAFTFSDQEVAALLAFLLTLTDDEFLQLPRHASPF
ncbi:MAG: c-type cytochrome [Cytophagales bacterium]|nr:c-type cytochrome [Cytophagales bacterium]